MNTKPHSHPTVGTLHIGVRDFFTRIGAGASTLASVASHNPDLMSSPASRRNMAALVTLENRAVLAGPLLTRGDFLALAATPVRAAAVHAVMANAKLGGGVRQLLANPQGYGMVYSDVVSGTF